MSKLTVSLAVLVGLTAGLLAARPAAASGSKVNPALKAACVKLFERQRACTDAFIPALVDLRVELDKPAGIAAKAKENGGRDALIAKAKEEWKKDSEDAAISARCEQMAASPKAAGMMDASAKCLAPSECSAFTACIIPVMRPAL